MTTFTAIYANKIKDFLSLDDSDRFGKINIDQIFDFTRAVKYGDIFTLYLMDIWQKDMISYL